MPLPKLKKLFVSETRLRFCAIDLRISFLALAIASKKNPKPSVKLAQSGCNLAQSVKLGVKCVRTLLTFLSLNSKNLQFLFPLSVMCKNNSNCNFCRNREL